MEQLNVRQVMSQAEQALRAGQLADAERLLRQILAADPNHANALHLLGVTAYQAGRHALAVQTLERAIAANPKDEHVYNTMGLALIAYGKPDRAVDVLHQALRIQPRFAEAFNNLGNALLETGDTEGAEMAFRAAASHKPGFAQPLYNLAQALHTRGEVDPAEAALREALRLDPNFAAAHNNLGNVLKDQGRLNDALESYRRAMAMRPGYTNAHSNLAYALHFHPAADAKAILDEARRWNEQHARPLAAQITPHTNDRSPQRKLRIGYVSADLRDHVVGRNLLPLFEHHDLDQFEIVCYQNDRRGDAITERIMARAKDWRVIAGRTDDEVAEMIRLDRIDILLDLSLHMAGNRLPVFARKPAPVQATFAGYPGTTGLDAIDYRLTDPYLDPSGQNDDHYAECSIRLPDTFWCYAPPADDPPVSALPADLNAFFTFGCLNNFCKINEVVLEMWSRVLAATPTSRMIILAAEGRHRRDVIDKLGVDASRIEFVPIQPRGQYLRMYHRIDLCLDTFPYNGHTTSLDALWMGVPVVTRCGETAVSRAGFSQLSNLALTALAADDEDRFVTIATSLAGDLSRLRGLRRTLRQRMMQSPLMDAPRFARGIEAAYRQMWQRWCARAG